MAKRSVADMFGAEGVETFLGLPKATPETLPSGTQAAVLGVPGVTPYKSVGNYCDGAPAAVRAAIVGDAPIRHHFDFDAGVALAEGTLPAVDCGDLPFDDADFEANRQRVRASVGSILDADAVPILIGGDDSLPIPFLQAYEGHGPLTILQIDAHIDWRDEVQEERWGLSSGMRRASEMPHVERIIQVGIRSTGSARQQERDDALAWGVHIVTGREIARHGIGQVLELIPSGASVVVCLDVDGLDPGIMPAALARTPGGLSYWDVIELLDGAAAKGTLAGFEMAEFVPEQDIDGMGGIHAARIIANVLRIALHGAHA